LLIGGAKEIQRNPDDVSEIAKLSKVDTEARVINDLTHILRLDERDPSIFGYKELLKKPMDPIVLELISNWLKCNG